MKLFLAGSFIVLIFVAGDVNATGEKSKEHETYPRYIKSVQNNVSTTVTVAPAIRTSFPVITSASKKSESIWKRQPPPGFVYFTFFLAIVTLITNFLGFIVKRIDRVVDRIYLIKQEYWTKTILVPVCLEPLRDFVITSSKELSDLEKTKADCLVPLKRMAYENFMDKFKLDKDSLLNGFMVIHTFSPSIYKTIADLIDELEDDVIAHCYANSEDVDDENEYYENKNSQVTVMKMFTCFGSILSLVSENHGRLFFDQKSMLKAFFGEIRIR